MDKYIYSQIGYMEIRRVSPVNCQDILPAMSGSGEDTIKKVKQAMFSMFSRATDNHIISENPAQSLEMPEAKKGKSHRAITDRERKILCRTATTHPAGAWVLLLLYSGLRSGESIVLTGADLVGGSIRVNKAYDRSARDTKNPKSEAGTRTVPIIAPLAAVLPNAGMGEPLFRNTRGRPLDEKSTYRMWTSFRNAMAVTEAKMIAKNEIPAFGEVLAKITPYDLRHTFCTDLERACVPITVAAKLMGHSKIEITARIYTHTDDEMKQRAAAQLATLISPDISPGFSPDNKPKKYRINRKNPSSAALDKPNIKVV